MRPGATIRDPGQKKYDKEVVADVVSRLANVEDWMVADKALKEISKICGE